MLVGSRHTGESLWAAMEDDGLPARTRLGPPGVDVEEFRPRDDAAARRRGADRAAGAPARTTPARAPSPATPSAAASALRRLDLVRDRLVCFIGKLIVSKGVDLLLAAWPLVPRVPRARRRRLRRLPRRPAGACWPRWPPATSRRVARDRRGRARLEGGPRAPLRHLLAFLDDAPARTYWAAARDLRERVVLTGRLEHDELAPLLAACEAQVVPSTFPEAFGMVAAEAAACGALPVSADHSGSAEVSAMLAAAVPPAGARLAVLPDRRRRGARDRRARDRVAAGARATARRDAGRAAWPPRTSASRGRAWPRGVIAAAQGHLAELPPVG